jgi:hypothetical protein
VISRVVSLLLALIAWFCSGWALLVGLVWGLGLKCDDSCSSVGGWRHDPDAWQWNGLAALGVLAFLAGGALVLFVWWRKPLYGAGAAVVGVVAVVVMANAFSSDWIEHFDRRSPGELLLIMAGVFAPILAVLLAMPKVVGGRER